MRETPYRPWPEFLVLRFEVQIVDLACEMLGRFQFALDKRLVDDDFRRDIR